MKNLLERLFQQEQLQYEEAKEVLFQISKGEAPEAQVAAFLSVFQMRNIGLEELRGFRDALLELCLPCPLQDYDAVDLCGTGGDGKDSFNISTLAAVVVAGAGYKVIKHGNYGVSSISGSSNVLESLGYVFTNDSEELRKQLDQSNICFLHAPLFHPAMKAVANLRKDLGIRTFFNILGPLVNPCQPPKQLVGVSDLKVLRLYQYLLQQSNKEFAIVHSLDGFDEVSLTADFKIVTNTKEELLSPKSLGMPLLKEVDLSGGMSVEEAAQHFIKILQNQGTGPQKMVVCVNAGIAIQRFKPQVSLDACIAEAAESLASGAALRVVKKLFNFY